MEGSVSAGEDCYLDVRYLRCFNCKGQTYEHKFLEQSKMARNLKGAMKVEEEFSE